MILQGTLLSFIITIIQRGASARVNRVIYMIWIVDVSVVVKWFLEDER
jgi:hypothetical protein